MQSWSSVRKPLPQLAQYLNHVFRFSARDTLKQDIDVRVREYGALLRDSCPLAKFNCIVEYRGSADVGLWRFTHCLKHSSERGTRVPETALPDKQGCQVAPG